MKYVCKERKCTGCYACIEKCPQKAIMLEDNSKYLNACIDTERCIDCGLCFSICQQNNKLPLKKPTKWWQGWAKSEVICKKSSSGGVATALAVSFINNGGIVVSCCFENGEYIFKAVDNVNDLTNFSGSFYIKSSMKDIYLTIKKYLSQNNAVLFIGLPCQVAGLKNFLNEKYFDKLYTVDLICHGSPSPRILEYYLKCNNIDINSIKTLSFRKKVKFGILVDEEFVECPGGCDSYTLAFLNALSYTENCYDCKLATLKRISDITLGDSWGTNLSKKRLENGLSLILCQTRKGEELIKHSDIHLEDVNLSMAIRSNHQLSEPSKKPKFREAFFESIEKGIEFKKIIRKYYPKQFYKQRIRSLLNIFVEGMKKMNITMQ